MVKVRIEYDGEVEEIERDAVIALFPGKESARLVVTGEFDIDETVKALPFCVTKALELASDSRFDYVNAMIKVHDEIDKKIKEELRAGGIHPLVDALVKTKSYREG